MTLSQQILIDGVFYLRKVGKKTEDNAALE